MSPFLIQALTQAATALLENFFSPPGNDLDRIAASEGNRGHHRLESGESVSGGFRGEQERFNREAGEMIVKLADAVSELQAAQGDQMEQYERLKKSYLEIADRLETAERTTKAVDQRNAKLAENLTNLKSALADYEQRYERLRKNHQEMVERAEAAEKAARAVESRFVFATIFSIVGAMLGAAAITMLLIQKR